MKKILLATTTVAAITALALAGCSSPREGSTGTDGEAEAGFAADSLIGVALPSKTSENWVLAGGLFEDGLKEAGFKGDVQYAGASNPVKDQQDQIAAMVTNGAKVIIVGAADGGQLATQVQQAKDAGAIVVAYDRLIINTENVDYYVAYDNFKVGQLQGEALLQGLEAKGEGPYNVELFSGSPDDANAAVFFNGAMDILQPKIDDGTLVVVSGQTDVKQTAIQGWKAEGAQARMETLLTGSYSGKDIHGVLSPNDTLARAIITAVKADGRDVPVVTGQDSEVESVKSIMKGEQYSTINKDTRVLVAKAIEIAQQLQKGEELDAPVTADNGTKEVPAIYLEPLVVTKENAAEAYANDPTLAPLTK